MMLDIPVITDCINDDIPVHILVAIAWILVNAEFQTFEMKFTNALNAACIPFQMFGIQR